MFEKIKNLLLEIEKTGVKEEKEERLRMILSTIKTIKQELLEIEKKAKELLGEKENNFKGMVKETIDSTDFIRKIQSARVNITTLIDKGWNLIVSGKYKEAVETLNKARKMDSENTKVYNLLGWAYINLEEYDKASLIFQEVLKIDPHNEMAQVNLGYISYKKGLYGEAIEKLSLIEKNAKDKQAVLYALFYLGVMYYEREMLDDSIEFLNKAISLGPNLYEAYYYLGKAYQKKGLPNLCSQIWEKLISVNKYNVWAQKARRELDGK
ncbi:MAG: tetratricopeptide repeat protein [candidate division WOR-3 bacterium]